jgi:hypothetical protein
LWQIKDNARDRSLLVIRRDDNALNEEIRQRRKLKKDKDRNKQR